MIFAEYIARDPAVPLEVFRHHGRQDWVAEGDVMVANLGRTMKLGPEPHYMCWWQIHSIARMDEWEAHFRTPEGRLYAAESPVPRAMRFPQAGLYDAVLGSGAVAPGLHLVEFFDSDAHEAAALAEAFGRRAAASPDARLAYVLRRLPLIGPDPGGLALWSFDSYAAAEPFLRRPRGGAVTITAAGLYRNFGDDIP